MRGVWTHLSERFRRFQLQLLLLSGKQHSLSNLVHKGCNHMDRLPVHSGGNQAQELGHQV